MLNHIFDTHAHYDDERFDQDRDQVISALPEKVVCGVVNVACDMPSCQTGLELTKAYPFFFCAVGIHPHAASSFQEGDLETLAAYTKEQKVVAIGEIGLDYHYDFSPRDVQKVVFERQLQLAKDLDMPVIIHDREAHGDTLELLKRYQPKGIVHCYSGSAEMAKELLKIGMYVAFGGAVTFKNARKTLEAAEAIPMDRLLVETDCPYMTPEPFRGKRCDSSMIVYTAQKLAELKGMDPQDLLDQTWENAKAVYQL